MITASFVYIEKCEWKTPEYCFFSDYSSYFCLFLFYYRVSVSWTNFFDDFWQDLTIVDLVKVWWSDEFILLFYFWSGSV